jgi:hypothetical protein
MWQNSNPAGDFLPDPAGEAARCFQATVSDNAVCRTSARLDDLYPPGSSGEMEQFDPERWDGMA